MRRVLIACLALASCVGTPAAPAARTSAPQPSVAVRVARASTQPVSLGNGLIIDVPTSWAWIGDGFVNRATWRLLVAGNGDLTTLPTLEGNGDIDAASLPGGRVTVEIESFCRLSCAGPTEETSLPVDWSTATPLTATGLPVGRHAMTMGLRWFDVPMFFVARWADDAPQSDIAAIADVARSIRPDPALPPRGEYRGWLGLGPATSFPIGTVTQVPMPTGTTFPTPHPTYDEGPFYLVRGRQHAYAFVSRLPFDARCGVAYDAANDRFSCAVAGRVFEWTRFGRYLGPEPASDLAQYRVIERDGNLWVRYGLASIYTPSVQDESAER